MVLGAIVGYLLPEWSQNLKVISTVFLNMIKCLLVPLLFGTLVVGIAGHSDDLKAVGRLAFKSIVYFEIVTTIALLVGLLAVNIAKPGVGVSSQSSKTQAAGSASAGATATPAAPTVAPQKVTVAGIVEHIFPKSFFEAAAKNDVLQVVAFTMLFGIALAQVQGKPRETMVGFCEALTEVMFKFIGVVMKFAPFGIGAAMAYTVGDLGLGSLVVFGKLVLTLYIALVVFCLLAFWPIIRWCGVSTTGFLKAIQEPALLAFSTTSSDAALPDAMKRMVAFGVPKRIVSFVMPLGYSFNLDGSTLHLAVASVFVAQVAGINLSISQQVAIMLTLMLTSKGMAGVPRASQVILAGTLVTFGLPLEPILLIIAIDPILDMARTTVNLVGNCLATVVMAKWEGELQQPRAHSQPQSGPDQPGP